MEKIKKSISKIFPYVKLYREDINEIIELLKENGFKDIEIQTGNYKLNSAEIDKLKQKELSKIQISSYNPIYLSINLDSTFGIDGARIYTSEDSTLAIGLIGQIGQLFKRKRRFLFSLTTRLWFAFSVVMIGQIIAYLLKKFLNSNRIFIFVLIFSWLFYAFAFFLNTGYIFPKNMIILDYKNDRPNFWKRNKDRLLIMLVSVILTALATYYVTVRLK